MRKLVDQIHDDKIIRFSITMLLLICIVGIIWLYIQVTILSQFIFASQKSVSTSEEIQDLIEEMQFIYDNNYINEQDKDAIIDFTLQGFVFGHGDRYGYYAPPTTAADMAEDRAEKLFGIGVEGKVEEDNGFYIVRSMDDSPAKEAGLTSGDVIVEINGTALSDAKSNQDFLEMLNSRDDNTADIKVKDSNGETRDITVTLRDVKSKSVVADMINDVKYIKIKSFTEYTDDEFIEEMNDAKEEGIEKYIIDLRQNTGGLADTVIAMLDYMVPEGLIVDFVNKNGENVEHYMSDENEFNGNIVILVDESTASASELFSQTLRDYEKAKIVGVNTFGKGTVVSTYQLRNGGTLTLSSARYHTKSGYEIEKNGIKPDYEVELTDEQKEIFYKLPLSEDTQVQKAIDVLNGQA